MTTYTKAFYKLNEVCSMLNLPESTIKYWVQTFEDLDPPKPEGKRTLYRPEDIEMMKQIQMLMHDRLMTIQGAKKYLRESKVPRHYVNGKSWYGYTCRNKDEALKILQEVTSSIPENPKLVNALEAVTKWVGSLPKSQKTHSTLTKN